MKEEEYLLKAVPQEKTQLEANQENIKVLIFFDEKTKKNFALKVYAILLIQITTTSVMVCFIRELKVFQRITSNSPALFYTSVTIMLILLLMMAILENHRKNSSLNFVLLVIFTIGESFLLGFGSIHFASYEILEALILTAIVCIVVMLFACQTCLDFTALAPFLFIAMTLMFVGGIALLFNPSKSWSIGYSIGGVILFALCLICDTQLMLSGKHKHNIDPSNDHYFAALCLYLDIINIFYYILLLFGFYRNYD